jgi:hypothetical protein
MANTHNVAGIMREYGNYPAEWDIEDQLEDSVAPRTDSQDNGWPDNLFETPGPSFEEPQSVSQDHKQPSKAIVPKQDKGFLAGPIDAEWLRTAIEISSAAAIASIPLWFKVGVEKDKFVKNKLEQSRSFKVNRGLRKKFGIKQHTMTRGLHALEEHGLLKIEKGGRGRCPVVAIINIQ